MKVTRFSFCLAATAVLAACSSTPFPEIPSGIRPRAEALQPEVTTRLFADIEAERSELVARQAVEEAACYQRFVINSCLLEVRGRYRPMLNALSRRETDVRAGVRERREEERQARMEEQRQTSLRDQERAQQRAAGNVPAAQKQADLDRRNAERAAAEPGNAARAQANRASAQQSHEKAVAEQAQRAAAAPAERSKYDAKQQAAQERREAQARRAAEKKTKPPAQPLPSTPASPSPGVPLR